MNELLNDKISILNKAMEETIESMQNDTKSSAGDKFETGREMMQIELNNLKSQMAQLKQSQSDLSKVNSSMVYNKVGFGSLVKTNLGIYFFSIAQGKIKLNNNNYFSISLASPIGQALKDKKAGDTINFNGRSILIEDIQ
ncbi:hypothetical protein [Carboxylicivirga linearis]|uniref:3-oxoacyl-ACP synthase n=1 Tax=Carboxylicivirga linearis TaxID=1628157 RepID=A0ABS5JWN4_9BACT|nr:hypothetical protein [Carboxylicivirga linearis]MBS2098756.1 hypothetical protein [Carboxylicivirga linearis]